MLLKILQTWCWKICSQRGETKFLQSLEWTCASAPMKISSRRATCCTESNGKRAADWITLPLFDLKSFPLNEMRYYFEMPAAVIHILIDISTARARTCPAAVCSPRARCIMRVCGLEIEAAGINLVQRQCSVLATLLCPPALFLVERAIKHAIYPTLPLSQMWPFCKRSSWTRTEISGCWKFRRTKGGN